MHRIRIKFIIGIIAVVSAVLALASCKEEHVHEWSEWEPYIESTCFVVGQEKSTCACGEVRYRELPKAHTFELEKEDIQKGKMVYKCTKCGTEEERDITPEELGVPIVRFTGSMSGISGTNRVTVNVKYDSADKSFEAKGSVKIQGATSTAYEKKNYSLKFRTDDGEKLKVTVLDEWGDHSKYCLKANYIDYSQLRNVVSAKLYGELVKTRDKDDVASTLTNGGAIDGFPVALYINGSFNGLYTFNTPKDEYVLGLTNEDQKQALLMAKDPNDVTMLVSHVEGTFEDNSIEVVYSSTEENPAVSEDWIIESFNDMIEFINNNDGAAFRNGISEYIDVDRAIDYMLFTYAISGSDNAAKNILWATYDGKVWVTSPYDLDSTWGLGWNGESFFEPGHIVPAKRMYNVLWKKLEENYSAEIAERWHELRDGVLSFENVEKLFRDFDALIPQKLRDAERSRWPSVPNNDIDYMEQITSFAKDNFEIIDNIINTRFG